MADRWVSGWRITRRLAGALVMVSAAACGSSDQGVSLEQLRNMTYTSSLGEAGRVQLVDGEYRARAVPNSSVDVSLSLTPQVAFGDLNGDRRPDAAAVLEADPGGSGSFYSLAVVVDEDGKARHVASMDLGDRTDVTAIGIANRTIRLEILKHAADDPLCCPSLRVTQAFQLNGTKVVPVPVPATAGAPTTPG